MIGIVYSGEDAAGTNIASAISEKSGLQQEDGLASKDGRHEVGLHTGNFQGIPLSLFKADSRLSNQSEFLSELEELKKCELVIFASRHRSAEGTPSFTAHSTGNWGGGLKWGGRERELGKTSARAIACAYRWFCKHKFEGFENSMEATHHGPTSLAAPCVFVELGSGENEWGREDAARHVADCILHICGNWKNEPGKAAMAFGGTHYCSKFNPLVEDGKYCVSFVAPKYAIDSLDGKMVAQMMEKTAGGVEVALVDWKGTNQPQRERLKNAFGQMDLQWERI